jgi:hypothetical protein
MINNIQRFRLLKSPLCFDRTMTSLNTFDIRVFFGIHVCIYFDANMPINDAQFFFTQKFG